MSSIADFVCLPCGQDNVPWPGTTANITPTTAPTKAVKPTDVTERKSWSISAQPSQRTLNISKSPSVRERRKLCPERQRDGSTPTLTLSDDVTIGDGHRSAASGVSTKPSSGNANVVKTYLDMLVGPFFIEVCSGSGGLARSVREHGLQVFEFDLTAQGGRRNLLHPSVLKELKALISHPECRGVWCGVLCGPSAQLDATTADHRLCGAPIRKIFGACHTSLAESAHVSTQQTNYY